VSPVDRSRQAATKRRLERVRFNRRYGGVVLWGTVGAVLLVVASGALWHYALSRDTIELTVRDTFQSSGENTQFNLTATDGTKYQIAGLGRARLYRRLTAGRGQRFRCDVRGLGAEIPFFWDLRREVTKCERLP
jgi:hypothetical protein